MNIAPRPKRRTPAQALGRALGQAVPAFGLIGSAFFLAATGATSVGALADPSLEGDNLGRPHAAGSPASAIAGHEAECWTSKDEPKAELPGAAVVRWTGTGVAEYVTDRPTVSSAFDEVLASAGFGDHDDRRIEVLALCA